MEVWIANPKTRKKSVTLTFAVWGLLSCLFKFLTNGVELTIFDQVIKFGTIDAALIGALLTPTLGAYVANKWSPMYKKEAEKAEKEQKSE